jgi:hypothetical protein
MSHLDELKTTFTNREALILGLCRTLGITRDKIEVHNTAQQLIGYHGTSDNKKAHVILRKDNARCRSDQGWELKDGTFVGHLDSFDYGNGYVCYDQQFRLKLTENYNFEASKMVLQAKGLNVVECKDNKGRLQLRAKMNKAPLNQMRIRI